MSETMDSTLQRLAHPVLIELLGTLGLAVTTTPIASLLLVRAWAETAGWIPERAADLLALSSLVLPLFAAVGCMACLASLALMQRRWRSGWERALLGLLLGGLVLGYWAGIVLSGLSFLHL